MYVIVAYDVKTSTPKGVSRLRRIAKICEDYGIRVQNSVFELSLMPDQWVICKNALIEEMDREEDSLRIYYLGSNWRRRVEHIGAKEIIDIEGLLII